jgi:hypothetical protein
MSTRNRTSKEFPKHNSTYKAKTKNERKNRNQLIHLVSSPSSLSDSHAPHKTQRMKLCRHDIQLFLPLFLQCRIQVSILSVAPRIPSRQPKTTIVVTYVTAREVAHVKTEIDSMEVILFNTWLIGGSCIVEIVCVDRGAITKSDVEID